MLVAEHSRRTQAEGEHGRETLSPVGLQVPPTCFRSLLQLSLWLSKSGFSLAVQAAQEESVQINRWQALTPTAQREDLCALVSSVGLQVPTLFELPAQPVKTCFRSLLQLSLCGGKRMTGTVDRAHVFLGRLPLHSR